MNKTRKEVQIAIRWTPDDIAAINAIADKEDRSRSEIVRFLVRWGVKQYDTLGSILALQLTSISELVQKRGGKGGKTIPIEQHAINRQAHLRLELLREAQVANDEQGFTSGAQRGKKARAR